MRQKIPVGLRGGGVTAGHPNAEVRQVADHLAQRRVFPPDAVDVVHPEAAQRGYVGFQGNLPCVVPEVMENP